MEPDFFSQNDTEIDKTIKDICGRIGVSNPDECLIENINAYISVSSKYDISNEELLKEKDVLCSKHFPKSNVELGCLISWWKKPQTNEDVIKISSQCAKPAQLLRDRGFIFRTKSNGRNWTFRVNGKEYREIVSFDPCRESPEHNDIKISDEDKRIIKTVFRKDLLGISSVPRDCEIDHRIPQAARKKKGVFAKKLTRATLESGEWIKDYQILSAKTNNMKREACNACMRGDDIPLPPCVSPYRSIYRNKFEEDNNTCGNCFWSNYLNPKSEFVTIMPNLNTSIEEERTGVEEVKRQIKRK